MGQGGEGPQAAEPLAERDVGLEDVQTALPEEALQRVELLVVLPAGDGDGGGLPQAPEAS